FLQLFFFFSSRRRHTRFSRDWSSDVCSSDLRLEKELRRQIQTVARGDDSVAGWHGDRASDGVRRPWETMDDLELTGMLRDLGAGRARDLALALIRVEKGTYGICVRCGETIGRERLDVLPEIE